MQQRGEGAFVAGAPQGKHCGFAHRHFLVRGQRQYRCNDTGITESPRRDQGIDAYRPRQRFGQRADVAAALVGVWRWFGEREANQRLRGAAVAEMAEHRDGHALLSDVFFVVQRIEQRAQAMGSQAREFGARRGLHRGITVARPLDQARHVAQV